MSNAMNVFDRSVRKKETIVRFIVGLLDSRFPIDFLGGGSIFRMNPAEEIFSGRRAVAELDSKNPTHLGRDRDCARENILRPAAHMREPLGLEQIRLTPPQFLLRFFALGNVAINEVNGHLSAAKRNAGRGDGSVQANTVLALPQGLQVNPFSGVDPN